jgi:hypothetical protein
MFGGVTLGLGDVKTGVRMDIELLQASDVRVARKLLVDRGVEALGIAPVFVLDDVVTVAIDAPATEARRAFAVLLVHALSVPGLLPSRGRAADNLRSFLERALLNPLRRAEYPFGGSTYDKQLALTRLHLTIDEHLRPLEPTFPRRIQG